MRHVIDPLISLAWRNLTEHRLRSLLTGLAISLGVGMVLAAAIVGQAASRQASQLSSQGVMSNTLLVQASLLMVGALLGLIAALIAGGLGLLMLAVWVVLVLPNGTLSVGVRPDGETVRIVVLPALRDLALAWAAALICGPLVAGLAAYLPARAAAALNVVQATRHE